MLAAVREHSNEAARNKHSQASPKNLEQDLCSHHDEEPRYFFECMTERSLIHLSPIPYDKFFRMSDGIKLVLKQFESRQFATAF